MRHLFTFLIITIMTIQNSFFAQNQSLSISKVKEFEHQLEDVMEIIDTVELKSKLTATEADYLLNPSEINKVRLGIIYHETALNLSFLANTNYKGYAKKGFDLLTEVFESKATNQNIMPFVAAYRASSLSLVGAETKKINLLFKAFTLFKDAVNQYADVSAYPLFLRGSVAENIPKIFFWLSKYAKHDFQTIIDKQATNNDYANWKIMSFTNLANAKQLNLKKNSIKAITNLETAIQLDPYFKAGRQKAEALLAEIKTKLY